MATPIYSSASTAGGYASPGAINTANLLGYTSQYQRVGGGVNNGVLNQGSQTALNNLLNQGYALGGYESEYRNVGTGGQYRQGDEINRYYTLSKQSVDPGTTLSNLLSQYASAYNTGQATNEQRYQDILGGYRQRYDEGLSTLQGLGDQQTAALNRQYDALSGKTDQSAISRGLANTTVRDSLKRGVEADRANAQGQLQEQLRREKLGYQTQLSGDTLKFMTDRTDQYPTLDQLGSIALAMGQYGKSGTTVNVGGSGAGTAAGSAPVVATDSGTTNGGLASSIGSAGLGLLNGSFGIGTNVGSGSYGGQSQPMYGTPGAASGSGGAGSGSTGGASGSFGTSMPGFDSAYESWTGGDQILRGAENTNPKSDMSDGYMSDPNGPVKPQEMLTGGTSSGSSFGNLWIPQHTGDEWTGSVGTIPTGSSSASGGGSATVSSAGSGMGSPAGAFSVSGPTTYAEAIKMWPDGKFARSGPGLPYYRTDSDY